MLLPGTEIHIVVFIILLFELVIFFFQIIYYVSRPSDKKRLWFLILLFLLIYYNSVSGFLPDEHIPIPIKVQNIVAYTGGLIMSMYFPFYFYKAFDLKLKFYAYWGSIVFLFLPFILLFLIPYIFIGNLDMSRKLVVIIPFFYALSFLYSLTRAIISKYKENKNEYYKKEIFGMYLGNFFWISLPIIVYFDGSQLLENSFANAGLLMMTILFIGTAIHDARKEYNELLLSGKKLQEVNADLAMKVKERTQELEWVNEQRTNTFINLAHETKTPLTLINNYLEEYIHKNEETKELKVIKYSIGKLSKDIVNFFDLERINKGFYIYDHNQISNFSKIIQDNIELFRQYGTIKNIKVTEFIQDEILIKADPESLYRIINNLIENAIKYTNENGSIEIVLLSDTDKISFSVKDNGMGIPIELQDKIFNPYYQINQKKKNSQGMGMGLAIVKKITDSLNGKIILISNPDKKEGTEISIQLPKEDTSAIKEISAFNNTKDIYVDIEKLNIPNDVFDESKSTIMLVEDNISLLNYMSKSLQNKYNIYIATSGKQALEKLQTVKRLDLIVSDVMMDNGDGFEFYKSVSEQKKFIHIPFVFLSAKANINTKIEGLAMGAIGYIYKPFLMEELTGKVDAVIRKFYEHRKAIIQHAYDSLLAEGLPYEIPVRNKEQFEIKCAEYNLTAREIDIVRLLAKGNTYKTIADSLFISNKTVAKHIQNIFEKVEVNSGLELLNKLTVNISI